MARTTLINRRREAAASLAVRHVASASDEQIERMVAVLLDAFDGDMFTSWMVGADESLIPLLMRAQIHMALIGGELYVAGFGPEDIQSVAVWFGSGQEALSSEEQANAGFNEFMGKLPDDMKAWWGSYFPQYSAFATGVLGEGAKKASWHLQLVGTARDSQRLGLGRALMDAATERAKTVGAALTAETQTEVNVKIYERLGWTLRGQMHVVGPRDYGECELYCLERKTETGA